MTKADVHYETVMHVIAQATRTAGANGWGRGCRKHGGQRKTQEQEKAC